MATFYRRAIVPAEELYPGCYVKSNNEFRKVDELSYQAVYVTARCDGGTRYIRWEYRKMVTAQMPVAGESDAQARENAAAEDLRVARMAYQ